MDGSYDAATIDTHMTEFNSQDIYDDGEHENDTYAAVYVPGRSGTNTNCNMTARATFRDESNPSRSNVRVYNGAGVGADAAEITIESDTGTHHTDTIKWDLDTMPEGSTVSRVDALAGQMVTLKIKPNYNVKPTAVYLHATPLLYKSSYNHEDRAGLNPDTNDTAWSSYPLIEEGALDGIEPDENGYYHIEVVVPYLADAAFEVECADARDSVINETNPLTNIHGAYLKHTEDELVSTLLTDKEKQIAANGGDIRFKLTGAGVGEIPDEIKQRFETRAKNTGYHIYGDYLDFNVTKKVKFRDAVNIEELPGGEVTVAMQLPSDLKSKGNMEYKLLRYHDGKVDVIGTEYDAATNELTFKSDRFSTYALVYKEKAKSPKTGQ